MKEYSIIMNIISR